MKRAVMAVSCLVASAAFPALAQDKVFVGQLVDYTGATSFVGKYYGPAIAIPLAGVALWWAGMAG